MGFFYGDDDEENERLDNLLFCKIYATDKEIEEMLPVVLIVIVIAVIISAACYFFWG